MLLTILPPTPSPVIESAAPSLPCITPCISNAPNCPATALAAAGSLLCFFSAAKPLGSAVEVSRSAVARSTSQHLDAGAQRAGLLQRLKNRHQIRRRRANRVKVSDDVGNPGRTAQFDDLGFLFARLELCLRHHGCSAPAKG